VTERGWKCGCGTWNEVLNPWALLDPETVVRCSNCQWRAPRLLIAHLLGVARERLTRELIALDRAGLI
jgi:hypothetical protein